MEIGKSRVGTEMRASMVLLSPPFSIPDESPPIRFRNLWMREEEFFFEVFQIFVIQAETPIDSSVGESFVAL